MRKDGRCVKKSYNPFKMWGSWVGLFLIGIFIIFPFISISIKGELDDLGICYNLGVFLKCLGEEYIENPFSILFSAINGSLLAILIILGSLILGFLLGWIIHSLIRRFRR